jgi:hypothetical protein
MLRPRRLARPLATTILLVSACAIPLEPAESPASSDASMDSPFSPADVASTPDVNQVCAPGQWFCPALGESALCDGQGLAFEIFPCDEGASCLTETGQCEHTVCQPYQVVCTGDVGYSTCGPDGQGWGPDIACEPGYYCANDHCVLGECLGHVLLLIDRSSSMVPHWGAVEASVIGLVAGHESARFGLMAFPQDLPCTVSDVPDIPLTHFEATETFGAYFDAHGPGQTTPLLAALEQVEGAAESLFGGEQGILVLLSDGEDTCEKMGPGPPPNLAGPLAAITASLLESHGVRTYVIGYNYEGDPQQLDTIASAGGTPFVTHLAAGDEGELIDAFQGIIDDWKLCF